MCRRLMVSDHFPDGGKMVLFAQLRPRGQTMSTVCPKLINLQPCLRVRFGNCRHLVAWATGALIKLRHHSPPFMALSIASRGLFPTRSKFRCHHSSFGGCGNGIQCVGVMLSSFHPDMHAPPNMFSPVSTPLSFDFLSHTIKGTGISVVNVFIGNHRAVGSMYSIPASAHSDGVAMRST